MAGDLPPTATASAPRAPTTFRCPSCGAGVVIRAQGLTVSVACSSCGSVIDATNENYQIIAKAASALRIQPRIPIGTRGKIDGKTWEVIGFMQRAETLGLSTPVFGDAWAEYLLFNPMHGFRWLTEIQGHWSFVTPLKLKNLGAVSRAGDRTVQFGGELYQLFSSSRVTVKYVIGEFYWRVQVGAAAEMQDYIAPPEMISSEKSSGPEGEELNWSSSRYLRAEEVRMAFALPKGQEIEIPDPIGVGANEPSPYGPDARKVYSAWGFFCMVLFVIQFASMLFSAHTTVDEETFPYHPGESGAQQVTRSFAIENGMSGVGNVQVRLSSPVSNSWLEIQGELVSDKDGESYEFEEGVEYYSGYDSDGSWSEGSTRNSHTLSSIPSGTYHLNLQAVSPAAPGSIAGAGTFLTGNEPRYAITVMRGVVNWSNFFWCLFLVSLYPVLVWWRSRSFERERWSNSDFSPYFSQSDGDD
jgi:hypothetical protein